MNVRAHTKVNRRVLSIALVVGALVPAHGPQANAQSMGPATLRAYRDSIGVASFSFYPSAGFGLILDAASGLKVGAKAIAFPQGPSLGHVPCFAKPLKEAASWIDRYRTFWEESLDRLDDYLKELQSEPDAKPTSSPRKKRSR